MKITRKEVEKTAGLARLALEETEVAMVTDKMAKILTYIDLLAEVDTQGVEPTYNGAPLENVMRPDTPAEGLPRAAALKNAPDSDTENFIVPRVLN